MEYPYDIVSFVRKKKTLSIEAHFVQNKEESPMKVFDDTFSRFSCNIIEGGAIYFNIPIEALPGIRAKTDAAQREQFAPKAIAAATAVPEQSGPAFTRKFVMGKLKGKTPIQVLLENPAGGKKVLNNQYTWLKEHLSEYPGNQELMDAIIDAAKVDLSTVSDTAPAGRSGQEFVLLDIGCRPLIRKTRDDGKCLVYQAKIIWDTSKNYSVNVSIQNYYANVVKNDNGTLNVNLSTKDPDSEREKDFNMTAEEWLYALHEMESARDCFKMLHFNEGYRLAEAAGEEARRRARDARQAS